MNNLEEQVSPPLVDLPDNTILEGDVCRRYCGPRLKLIYIIFMFHNQEKLLRHSSSSSAVCDMHASSQSWSFACCKKSSASAELFPHNQASSSLPLPHGQTSSSQFFRMYIISFS